MEVSQADLDTMLQDYRRVEVREAFKYDFAVVRWSPVGKPCGTRVVLVGATYSRATPTDGRKKYPSPSIVVFASLFLLTPSGVG